MSTRLTRNPGLSRTTIGHLPSRFAWATTAATVASLVAGPRTTSTSVMRRTGLKKCMPQNRAGSASGSASRAIGFVEVLVAMIVVGDTTRSMSTSTCRLTSVRSVTLSMTRSAPAAAAVEVAVRSRPARARAAAGSVARVARSQAASARISGTAPSTTAAFTSQSVTGRPARRWAAAMPAPMMPAPMMAAEASGAASGVAPAAVSAVVATPLSRRFRSPIWNTRSNCVATGVRASRANASDSIRPAAAASTSAPARIVSRMRGGAG